MKIKLLFTCVLFASAPFFTFAQENSPYSRYGVGNIVPQGTISTRGMGGISAAISDPTELNTLNPAASANLLYTTLDIGLEYNGRNLKSTDPIGNYRSNNGIISYLQVGLPLLSGNKKAFRNKTSWSLNFGLKPISKINYKISGESKIGGENVQNIYEGDGGINEAFIGSAVKIRNFSIGFNTGYLFGDKNYSNRLIFQNDSVAYARTNFENKTRFGGMFLNAGLQYGIKIKGGIIRLGAYGNLKSDYNGNRDELVETFTYDANGSSARLDSVYEMKDQNGTIRLPSTIGAGFSIEKEHFLIGADFETTSWDDYRFYGQKDLVQNSWVAKAGIQYFPATVGTNSGYFNYVKYRAGFSFGEDYINVNGKLPVYTISVGAGFPLKLKRNFYETQYSVMNLGFEFGNRGNANNNITENIYKVSLGFSLNDVWFRRQKYQ